MENEAKGERRDVETEQFCSGKFNYYFQEICENFYIEFKHCPVVNNSGCFILKARSEDSCSILEVL